MLFMIGNAPYATVSNTAQSWTTKCLIRRSNAYAADKKKNLSNLSSYAKKMRVYKKLMDVMEVLLNG